MNLRERLQEELKKDRVREHEERVKEDEARKALEAERASKAASKASKSDEKAEKLIGEATKTPEAAATPAHTPPTEQIGEAKSSSSMYALYRLFGLYNSWK